MGVGADEGDGAGACRRRERVGGVGGIAGAGRGDSVDGSAVYLDLDRLGAGIAGTLGGVEGNSVLAGREGDRLADHVSGAIGGAALYKGDLGSLRGVRVAGGEGACRCPPVLSRRRTSTPNRPVDRQNSPPPRSGFRSRPGRRPAERGKGQERRCRDYRRRSRGWSCRTRHRSSRHWQR